MYLQPLNTPTRKRSGLEACLLHIFSPGCGCSPSPSELDLNKPLPRTLSRLPLNLPDIHQALVPPSTANPKLPPHFASSSLVAPVNDRGIHHGENGRDDAGDGTAGNEARGHRVRVCRGVLGRDRLPDPQDALQRREKRLSQCV